MSLRWLIPNSVTACSVLEGIRAYRWAPGLELDVSPQFLPEPPAWLAGQLDELATRGVTSARVAAGGAPANEIPTGQRNATLARLAGHMRHVGMSRAEIAAEGRGFRVDSAIHIPGDPINMHVMINTPGSCVEKWNEDEPDIELIEAEALGYLLGAALYAVGPARLDEVLGRCITELADCNAFVCSRELPARDALDDLCDEARRIVDAWKKHDQKLLAT